MNIFLYTVQAWSQVKNFVILRFRGLVDFSVNDSLSSRVKEIQAVSQVMI